LRLTIGKDGKSKYKRSIKSLVPNLVLKVISASNWNLHSHAVSRCEKD